MRIQSVTAIVRVPTILAVALLTALATFAGPPVQQLAQFRVRVNPSRARQDNVLLPSPPREFKQALSRAQRSINDGEFSDAIDALVEILGRSDAEDYFIGTADGFNVTEDGGTQQSLKSAARALLGSLPKAGQAIYELQYGVEARQLLEQAVDARDIEKLTDVSRRFFHTLAGYDATFLLGQHLFDRHRPLAAAMTLARLMDRPAAINRYGPELSLLLSMSWQLAAHPENARDTLLELKRRDPDATVRIGDNEIPLFGENVDPLAWLAQIVGNQPDGRVNYVDQWALFRGDANRNSASNGGMPLPGIQWRVDVCPESVEDEAQVRRLWKQNIDQGLPMIPALHPLAVGDYVLMRTLHGIFGVDVETGKRIWPFPWYQEDESLIPFDTGSNQLGVTSQELARRQQRLQQRIWRDLPQGQLSSDGQFVFAVHSATTNSRVPERFNAFGRGRFQPAIPIPGNQLVALELATQGKIRWLLGGEDGDLPELQEVFFMGPPLPLSGRLYVVVELKDEIKLLVLDTEKGAVLWSQQLAHIESPYQSNLAGTRRMAGASPSFGDGILVCPTSAGAVVAVDLATRSLAWGYKYEQSIKSSRVSRNVIVNNRAASRLNFGSGWADSSVTIDDGRVLLTPVEANSLICLDLLTGKPAWKSIPRGNLVYVAGVEQGVIVLVGKNHVRGIRLKDGKDAWEKPLKIPGGAMPSGRGFISDGEYFLPTTEDQIVRFRIVDGAIVEVVDSEYPMGNLICYKDKIMSQTPDALYAFYQRERIRELIPQRLAENPNDPRTLADYARLLIDDGEWEQAATHLRRALDLYPPDSSHRDGAKSLLVNVLLNQMRRNFDQSQHYREELEQNIVDPQQRVELYRVLATGLQERNQVVDAFNTYVDLARLEAGEFPTDVDDVSALERCEENRRVRLDLWLRSQLRELWAAADLSQREQMTARVAELASEVQQSPDGDVRTRFVASFQGFPQAEAMVPDLAREAVAAENLLSAERWFTFLQQSADPRQAATATANLAELYASRHRYEDVYDQLLRLDSQWPSQMIDDNVNGHDLARQGLEDLRTGAESGVDEYGPGQLGRWPVGRVKSSVTLPKRATLPPDRLAIDLREIQGQWNDEYRLAFDRQRYEIVVLDSHGADKISVPCQGRRRTSFYSRHHNVIHAKAFGSLLVVSLGYEIVAIDLIGDVRRNEDRVLWRVELVPGQITSPFLASKTTTINNSWTIERFVPTDQGRRVGILGPVQATGVCFQKNTELRCVDPLSGHIRWLKRGLPPGCDLFGDAQRVFVVPPKSEKAMVLAMSDGQSLGERSVPQHDRRWITQGSRILTWDGEHVRSQTLKLRMYDAWEEKDVWSREYAELSRGYLLGVDELVVMQPDGKLDLLNLASGELQFDAKLLPEPKLSQIFALRSRDQYLFITNQPIIKNQGNATRRGLISRQSGNVVSPGPVRVVNGRVYAYDRATKTPMWSVPAEIDRYSLPLGQAVNSPALTFVRYVRKQVRKNNRTTPQQLTELLCLDRRDGRLLAKIDTIPGHQALQRIEAEPAEKRVVIELRSRKGLVLNFSDEPRPPAAPLQSQFRRVSALARPAVVDTGLSGVPPERIPLQRGLTDLATQIIDDPFK